MKTVDMQVDPDIFLFCINRLTAIQSPASIYLNKYMIDKYCLEETCEKRTDKLSKKKDTDCRAAKGTVLCSGRIFLILCNLNMYIFIYNIFFLKICQIDRAR